MLKLMVEPYVCGADLWMCFKDCVWIDFGSVRFRQGPELALIPNMIYLQRVQATTQCKSERLQTKEEYNHGKPREVARNMLVVRQQTREVGMEFKINEF